MRPFLLVILIGLFPACENAGKAKTDINIAVKDGKNSAVFDSIRTEGERIMDTVKTKSSVLLDSSRKKGGRLLNEAGEGLKQLSKKLDSTK